jgi:anthranilate phosphoribosyltransferase
MAMIKEATELLKRNLDLSREQAQEAVGEMLAGNCSEDEIARFLGALADKGESIDEIVGFYQALMQNRLEVKLSRDAVDIVGTGGSGRIRYNISTTAAFILAAAGFPVAKHGNKGSSRPNGSFDLLEKLGISLNTSAEDAAELFDRANLCFLYARTCHPAMRHVGPARARLKRRTVFNIIGPLCNPAAVPYQVVGVSDLKLGLKLAECLARLGRKRALVVYGEPGIDEFSISGPSRYWQIESGVVRQHLLNPADLGLRPVDYGDLPGGDADENYEIFFRLLDGGSCNGLLDMLCLNAAAGIYTLGAAHDFSSGLAIARETVMSGKARLFFDSYMETING